MNKKPASEDQNSKFAAKFDPKATDHIPFIGESSDDEQLQPAAPGYATQNLPTLTRLAKSRMPRSVVSSIKVPTAGADDESQRLTATPKRKQQLRRNQRRVVRPGKNTVSTVHNLL